MVRSDLANSAVSFSLFYVSSFSFSFTSLYFSLSLSCPEQLAAGSCMIHQNGFCDTPIPVLLLSFLFFFTCEKTEIVLAFKFSHCIRTNVRTISIGLPQIHFWNRCTTHATFYLFPGDATVLWKQGERVISAGSVQVRKDARMALVEAASLRITGVDVADTG